MTIEQRTNRILRELLAEKDIQIVSLTAQLEHLQEELKARDAQVTNDFTTEARRKIEEMRAKAEAA